MTSSPQKQPVFIKVVLVLAIIVATFFVGYASGSGSHTFRDILSSTKTSSASVEFGLVDDVWEVLQQRYVGSLDKTTAVYGAIRGMIASLKDPYTVFFSPEEAQEFENEIQGTFQGVGAEIGIKENQLVVIAPLPNSPAEKAGLVAGDAILSIDGVQSSTLTLDEAVQKIRGKEGTQVSFSILKTGATEPSDISITRATITIQSVRTESLDDNLFLIELSYFGPNTSKDFQAAVNQALLKNAQGIILDMRSNPGGYLDTAVDVASHFLPDGSSVVIEEASDGSRTTLSSKNAGALLGVPAVVLVDQGSASGSEIVAGALQDLHAATLVGVTTYGKGSVQQVEQLPDGSSLKVTVAHWLTPNGRSINEHGVSPDVVVERSEDDIVNDRDPQRDRAIEVLKELISASLAR